MNEHDIQPEPRFRSRHAGADPPMDSVDIRTSCSTVLRIILGISWLTCGVAAVGTASFFGIAAVRGGRIGWEYAALFGTWDSTIYVLPAFLAWWFHRSYSAAGLMMFATLAVSAYGLFAFYSILEPHFAPLAPGRRDPMNCVGPVVELFMPGMQAAAITAFAGVAGVCSWIEKSWNRS